MPERNMAMRLNCRYQQPNNEMTDVSVQYFEAGEWHDFELYFTHPAGFLLFVYAFLHCQHRYLCVNAAERDLIMDSASGLIEVRTDEEWHMQKLRIHFDVQSSNAVATADDAAYIIDRMQHCPVSVNIKDIPDTEVLVEFH
jgi:hypothetical protein